MIDIDRFKRINDERGHDVGDLVLKAVANCCHAAKRETDIVGRIGGEEFAILLPETNEAAAVLVAERLRKRVEQLFTLNESTISLPVTVSIGVASASLSMSSFAAFMKRADLALYEANGAGRNLVVSAKQSTGDLQTLAAE